MNRRLVLSFWCACLCLLAQASGLNITGLTTDQTIKRVYLFRVIDEHNKRIALLDSVEVVNSHFAYRNDSLYAQVLFLTAEWNKEVRDVTQNGSFHFFNVGDNRVSLSKSKDGKLLADLGEARLDAQYQSFKAEQYRLANRQALDSLDALFYTARAKGNTEEMARIKAISNPIYDAGAERVSQWQAQLLKDTRGTAFGAYLLYTYRLMYAQLETPEAIAKVRSLLDEYDDEAKQTEYYHKMNRRLKLLEQSAVGQQAPPIAGVDRKEKPLSLADFKGKYVLVDFWSSGCKWCRAETPNLLKTLEAFKGENFTILGVSTDLSKAEWTKAIEEDKAYWNHLILPRNTRDETLKAYSIVAIPEILLVDPAGNIIAKGLRGDAIYQAVKEALKK